jgi:hypothetical protein
MANKYFNKQVAESRKPLASGSMVKAISEAYKPHSIPPKDYKKSTSKELKALEGFRKVSPKPLNIGRPIPRGGLKFQEEQLEKAKNKQDKKYTPRKKQKPTNPLEPTSKDIEKYKSKTKSESPERIKRQADYMKKHGKNEPSRKTLSVTNSYKKEVEGLK